MAFFLPLIFVSVSLYYNVWWLIWIHNFMKSPINIYLKLCSKNLEIILLFQKLKLDVWLNSCFACIYTGGLRTHAECHHVCDHQDDMCHSGELPGRGRGHCARGPQEIHATRWEREKERLRDLKNKNLHLTWKKNYNYELHYQVFKEMYIKHVCIIFRIMPLSYFKVHLTIKILTFKYCLMLGNMIT